MVFVDFGILIVSIIILGKSAQLVIENVYSLSKYFQINQITIGFLLLSVSTSLPELSIAVNSAIAGEGAISAGDVFGSNIANILIVLGIGAFLYGIKIQGNAVKQIGLILLITTLISIYIIFSSALFNRSMNSIEGLILIFFFVGFSYWTIKNKDTDFEPPSATISKKEAMNSFLYFFSGIFLVIISSVFVVNSAIKISTSLGVAESFIGATIIAIGTSLPELSTTLTAIKKKYYDLAIGNIVGSNMANITLVLGLNAFINPIHLNIPVFIAALLFAVIANFLLFYFSAVNKGIGKFGGLLFLVTYVFFIIAISGLQGANSGILQFS